MDIASSYEELVTNINNAAADVVAKLNADNSITLSNNSGEEIIIKVQVQSMLVLPLTLIMDLWH